MTVVSIPSRALLGIDAVEVMVGGVSFGRAAERLKLTLMSFHISGINSASARL